VTTHPTSDELTYVQYRTEQGELEKQIEALVTPFCRRYHLIPQDLKFEWNYHGECRVRVCS
jgi:hypothetical protein